MGASASELLPNRLWVRARTNSLSPQRKIRLLEDLELTDVVCTCYIRDSFWDNRFRLTYHYWPMSDSTQKLPARLEARAEFLADRIENGGRALVYCDSGRNRSGLLAALVVKHICAVTGKEAIDIVREGRPMLLKNPLFVEYLESL